MIAEKILLRLLLGKRNECTKRVQIRGKNYIVSIQEFVPAPEWVPKMEKALRETRPKI